MKKLFEKPMKKEIWLLLLGIFIVVFFMIFMNNFYESVWKKSGLEEADAMRIYDYQYEMIVDNGNAELWQAVYESADKQAKAHNACLQFHASDKGNGYDEADYMEISIAAQADGIILEYNGEQALKEKIDKAVEAGIPVVTVMKDAPKSLRQSFVGVNDYQMGQAYGEQVVKLLDEETEQILILLNSEKEDSEKSQIYSQISSAVLQSLPKGKEIQVTAQNLIPNNKFDIEEAIRMIFQDSQGPPQILVCTDEMTTECAYQAMIDFNMVGEVKILGYYISDTILEAVEKSLIPVTCSLDTDQMGKDSVEALWEYSQEGRVNSYYNVELNFITKDNMPRTDEQEEKE